VLAVGATVAYRSVPRAAVADGLGSARHTPFGRAMGAMGLPGKGSIRERTVAYRELGSWT